MFLVRQIKREDLASLKELAAQLDSFNLPNEDSVLKSQIEDSIRSFEDPKRAKDEAIYMFVLEDSFKKKVIGTSLVFGKKGTKDKPNTYLRVLEKVHKDSSLEIQKSHQLLRFEFDTDGPSEIGGLILHPDFRGLPLGLGKLLSFARFLFVGLNLERFENQMLAELLPPFNEDGSSELWEAFGRRFTGLPYKEADRLSRTNKDFITNLFPTEDIYTCLFSEKAKSVIGETGEATKPVQHMLEKVGFKYLNIVDPFDGGPHYGAKTSEITLIKRMQKVRISEERLTGLGRKGIIGISTKDQFLSVYANHRYLEDSGSIQVEEEIYQLLKNNKAPLDQVHLMYPV